MDRPRPESPQIKTETVSRGDLIRVFKKSAHYKAKDPASFALAWICSELAILAHAVIRQRIKKGKTVDGRPMIKKRADPYSPGYERYKISRGRRPYTSGDRFKLTGEMLTHFRPDFDESTGNAFVGFLTTSAATKARANDLRRPTFALGTNETNKIFEIAGENFEKKKQKKPGSRLSGFSFKGGTV